MSALKAHALLEINLKKIAENYQFLKKQLASGCDCAAVVKANSYGLGANNIAAKLYSLGCRSFYVAYFSEALEIRKYVPDAEIFVLHGFADATLDDYKETKFVPVLNSAADIEKCENETLPVSIHIDTGMNRLGISLKDIKELKDKIVKLNIRYIMSHLACAEAADNPKNQEQLDKFNKAYDLLGLKVKRSFVSSSGIFLGKEYHFDQVRPGAALYGINPQEGKTNVVKNAISLKVKVLHVHEAEIGSTVGYGAHYTVTKPTTLATIAIGYADGWFRSLSNSGFVFVNGEECPIVGRISMDSTVVDITDIGSDLKQDEFVEVIGDSQTPDDIAIYAKTIGYEILTSLGSRYEVIYTE